MKTGSGSIFVVGIGPGNAEGFTIQAKKALETCDVIAGYSVYVDLVKLSFPELENKIFFTSGMKAEIERCQKCFEYALQNKKVCLVCSGDAGVYGMAEPVLSLQKNPLYQQVEVVVIPGVSAALSGAAILGH